MCDSGLAEMDMLSGHLLVQELCREVGGWGGWQTLVPPHHRPSLPSTKRASSWAGWALPCPGNESLLLHASQRAVVLLAKCGGHENVSLRSPPTRRVIGYQLICCA